MRKAVVLFFIGLFLLPFNAAAADKYAFSCDGPFAVPQGTDTSCLGSGGTKLEYRLEMFDAADGRKMYAVSDFHAVIPQELGVLAAIISNHEDTDKVFERMIETTDLNPEDSLMEPHFQKVHNGVKFLGMGAEYKYTTRLDIRKYTDDEFVMKWIMTDIELGNMEAYEGYWFLKELDSPYGGPATYVRLRSETIFRDIIPLQDVMMSLFGPGETQAVFRSLEKAAARVSLAESR